MERIDFTVVNEGSIFLLQPLTPAAITWTNKYLPEDRLCFGSAVAVEHRFIADILQGITDDGLVWRAQ
jgi:hypothetical protein